MNVNELINEGIRAEAELVTQKELGEDIDRLIQDVAQTHFEGLAQELENDQKEDLKFKNIKKGFVISSICLAVISVIISIASIILSAGLLTAGALTVAIVSGSVGISASFNQLDTAIDRFIKYQMERNQESFRIPKLARKIEVIKKQIHVRHEALADIDKTNMKDQTSAIFEQVKELNKVVRKIKTSIPSEVALFPLMNPGFLLGG